MKISKLFHWLYAILMLLPFLVFLPNAFYYGFNEHAVAQEKTEQVPVYYETNEVNSLDDLIVGNYYTLIFDTNSTINGYNILLYEYHIISQVGGIEQSATPLDVVPYLRIGNLNFVLDYEYITSNSVKRLYGTNLTIDIRIRSISGIENVDLIQKCERQYVKEYQPLVTNMSITDSMSYAWDSVWQNDLFSWSYGSFLTEPFIYIGNVFNVPVDNSLYYALSYWLDISIIWLCFDMVMYVPLLVHRWLDKGIIE